MSGQRRSGFSEQEARINDYNPALLYAWNGNLDIQYVGERCERVTGYVTAYATKNEIAKRIQTLKDSTALLTKNAAIYALGLAQMKSREVGGPETVDELLRTRHSARLRSDGFQGTESANAAVQRGN